MADIYVFTEDEKEIINFLKKIVTIKYGCYRTFKLKKEKYIFNKIIYKTVILYAPQYFDENTINAYLLKNEYIIYKLAYYCFYPKSNVISQNNKILYLGRLYDFQLKPEIYNTYKIDNENLIIYAGKNLLNINNLLEFYHKQALFILPSRIYIYGERLKLNIKTIKIGIYKSYWGCCYINIIKLNEKLILSPIKTIDSVINHELTHIFVPNHSKEFYQKLEEIYPSYYKDFIWLKLFMPQEYPPKK